MSMFSNFCTNETCRQNRPRLAPDAPRSLGWAYCNDCFARIYPKAAIKRGINVEVARQELARRAAIKLQTLKAIQKKQVRESLPTLFDDIQGGR